MHISLYVLSEVRMKKKILFVSRLIHSTKCYRFVFEFGEISRLRKQCVMLFQCQTSLKALKNEMLLWQHLYITDGLFEMILFLIVWNLFSSCYIVWLYTFRFTYMSCLMFITKCLSSIVSCSCFIFTSFALFDSTTATDFLALMFWIFSFFLHNKKLN